MSSLITLRELLSKGKKFVVPNYQRGYVWGKKRNTPLNSVEYILESISNTILNKTSPTELFLQGITVSEKESEIILIDGQQRVTFFYLLLTVLGEKNISIRYPIREDSEKFLEQLKLVESREEKIDLCKEEVEEPFQDIYYFKKTVRIIDGWLKTSEYFSVNLLLDGIKFLYIDIPESQATMVFSMMNANKAEMKPEEIIKAEILRLISLEKRAAYDGDVFAEKWQQNMLRSRYAREWDKWVYWWNREDVQWFFHTKGNVLGLLLRVLFEKKTEGALPFKFENFRDKILRANSISESKNAKKVFYDLRKIQKTFEDIFNNVKKYNCIGSILFTRKDCMPFWKWVFDGSNVDKIEEYSKLAYLELGHSSIVNLLDGVEDEVEGSKKEAIENAVEKMKRNDLYYSELKSLAEKQLLRRNIKEDSKLGRKFDFHIWENKSLEHIAAKSKFYRIEENGDIIRGDLKKIEKEINDDGFLKFTCDGKGLPFAEMVNEWNFCGKGSEHCIGNLVLLYHDDNDSFGTKSFDEKRQILFDVSCGKRESFPSLHLLHTVSVFSETKWDVSKIQEYRDKFIDEMRAFYGV